MNRIIKTCSVLIAGISMLAPASLCASKLLTDNAAKSGPSSYPSGTSKIVSDGAIDTGATFTYVTDVPTNMLEGNTDPDIVKMDITKLQDGYNERVGRTAVYGKWQSKYGATVLIDLQKVYDVDMVSASIRVDSKRGAATFKVEVSTDGENYTPFGTWDESTVVLDPDQDHPGRNTEISIAGAAPTKARYVKVYLSNWNADHTKRKYVQLIIGEIAVWGEDVAVAQ